MDTFDKTIKEIEDAILAAGYKSYSLLIYNSRSFGTTAVSYEINLSRTSFVRIDSSNVKSFSSLSEMHTWAMNLKPLNDVLYRKFKL